MRVAICMTCPPGAYSGGRYAGLGLAEMLAMADHETHFIANNRPAFYDDFALFPAHERVQLSLTADFRRGLPEGHFDIVVLVPGTGLPGFYDRVQIFAIARGAHLVLFNFESGNWFNAVSPYPRPLKDWKPWRKSVRFASLILSITQEGNRWARDFYSDCAPHAGYAYSYPAINSYAADAVGMRRREKRFLTFIRFKTAQHKGSGDLDRLFAEEFEGYTYVFVVGLGDTPQAVVNKLAELSAKYGVTIEFRHQLSDREKFEEIKRAKLVLFPSLFEGFGYPPVEALYCGTPCVAFDLPVLRESSDDAPVFARHNDWDDFRAKMRNALTHAPDEAALRSAVARVTDIKAGARHLSEVLEAAAKNDPPGGGARVRHRRWLRLRDGLRLNDADKRWDRIRHRAAREVKQSIRTLLRPVHLLRPRTRRVSYIPAFDSPDALTNHYYRACWYLPRSQGRCHLVALPHTLGQSAGPGPCPEPMAAPTSSPGHIRLFSGRWPRLWALLTSELLLFWNRPPPSRLQKVLEYSLGIQMAHVATKDLSATEYGTYAGLLWRRLTPARERRAILAEHHARFADLAKQLRAENYGAACVFGTGPSLQRAFDFDFRGTLCIVCNSIVQSEELLDHIQPKFVCAGDVVSHFGVSRYAAQFREDLARVLRERDIHFLTTARYGWLFLQHYPELGDKVFLVDQGPQGPVFDLAETYALPRLDSTLNIHMLPLAATFSNTIFLLGCDGKAPEGTQEDFWAHAPGVQYEDLVRTGLECHPSFDTLRQISTYDRYLRSVSQTLNEGESRGIAYRSLARSYVDAIQRRALPADEAAFEGLEKPCPVTEIAHRLTGSGREES